MRREWKPYRRAMRKKDQEFYDAVFDKAERKAHAASHMNHENPVLMALFSVLVEQEKEISRLEEKMD
ncbi:MAG: hypothetical protein ABEK01_01110 [Candidatus Nanohaloarchaea archaeon]